MRKGESLGEDKGKYGCFVLDRLNRVYLYQLYRLIIDPRSVKDKILFSKIHCVQEKKYLG